MPLMTSKTITAVSRGKTITGTVIKMNRTTCLIQVTGGTTRFPIGTEVKCPYSIITEPGLFGDYGVDRQVGPSIVVPIQAEFHADSFWVTQNLHYLIELGHVYNSLSPENLTCDGEASHANVMARKRKLDQKLQLLFQLMGVTIDEDTCCDIMASFNDTIRRGLENDILMLIRYKAMGSHPVGQSG